ncbi:hypothetical protein ACFY36_01215 [Actinoplanes sp. NPDC000266]
MDVSDELNGFLFWLAGESFPGTDEDKLRQLAQVHRDAASEIVKILPFFTQAIGEIDAAVEGAANAAVVDALREYTQDPGYLGLSARYVRRMGDDMDEAATEVEYAKLMIVATLIELMLEFLIALAVAFLFPGALSALATRLLIGRFKIWAWLARAIVAVVLSQVAGVGMQVLMDVVVQAIQIREGHRKSIDWDKIRTSAAVGSLGGAIGVILGGAGGTLGNFFKKLLGGGSEYIGHAAHAMGTEMLTEVSWAVSQGEKIDWSQGGSIHGAALSGLTSGSVEFAGGKLGHALAPPAKRPDFHGQILRELSFSTSARPTTIATQDGQWLVNGEPLLVRPAPDGRPGLTLLSDTDLASIAGRPVLPSRGGPVVMVHGVTGDGPPAVKVPLAGGGTARLTPEDLARMLGPQPVRSTLTLLACSDGDVSAEFARRLAAATGHDVLTPEGQVRAGALTRPGQPVSVGDQPWLLFTPGSADAWDVVNDERPFEGITARDAPHDPTGLTLDRPAGPYATRPELLYEVAGATDLDGLTQAVTEAAQAQVRDSVKPHLARLTPGGRDGVAVDTSGIETALRDDLPSFFVSGGRTFDVKDGWGRWHTVTVNPVRLPGTETSAGLPSTKYDTRVDATTAMRETHTSGESLAVGAGVTLGGRIGPGGGLSGEVALAQATETTESSTTVFDSHNVRSGQSADIVRSPVRFSVTVGHPARPGADVTADVGFYVLQDIATATPRDESRTTGPFDVATLVENTSPVRILGARLDAGTLSWNEAAEHILTRLRATGVADPGSTSREQARSLLSEANVLGQLMPALESPAHSPLILSPSRRQAVSLEMTAEVTGIRTVADVAKSSFRWQPGITETGKRQHTSQVGGGGSVVPIRWGFGPAWVQARLSAGFRRTTATSAGQSSTSRTGTEFKDVPNTLTELTVKVKIDPAVRLNALRHPMRRTPGMAPVEVELTVLSRLPRGKLAELLNPPAGPAPGADPPPRPAPPFAEHGGHAMPLGMSRFRHVLPGTERLVRRIGGGMLPRFRTEGVARRMGLARSAAERQRNQAELDRVLSAPGLRQSYTALLNGGVTAVLTRTGVLSDRHTVVHVRARHPDRLRYKGPQPGVAVRTFQSSGEQDGVSAGGQWRAAVAGEAAFIGRYPGRVVNAGVTAGGAVEANRRWGLDGSVETTGQESALHGGTPDSEAYEGDLELEVTVHSYRTGPGWDRGSRIGVGRTVKGRDVPAGARPLAPGFHRDTTTVRGHVVPRYRLVDRRPVRVLYARSAVPQDVLDAHPVSVQDRESSPLQRRTAIDPGSLRDYVDRPGTPAVSEWQYVESMPAARTAIDLVRQAVQDTQNYGTRKSHRRLGGLRGDDALAEGMPVWAALNDRLTAGRQIANLAAMTEARWSPETLTTMDDGGQLDVALAAHVTNPRIVTARAETAGENAPGGGTQVSGSKTLERHFLARVAGGFGLRKPGTDRDRYGGGATGQAGYQRLFAYRLHRGREKVGGFTERNINNRKGRARTYLVVADLRLTAGADVATPARFPRSMVPGPLQPSSWEHHKTVRHSAVVRNGVYLRLTEAQAIKAGLLTTEDDGEHVPHGPRPRPAFTEQVRRSGLGLPPGRSPGQGLQAFREVPSLIRPATEALERAIAADPGRRDLLRPVLDALTARGLADPMLNRDRLRQMLSRAGVRRSWGNLFDGGVSLIHAETGKVTQRLYDVRLEARLTGEAVFDGFQADHDDIDLRTIGTRGSGRLVRTARGSQVFAGAAGTAVINPQGKQAAIGAGHQYAANSQTGHTSAIETGHRTNNISSARGVKARIVLRPTFELKVYHRGQAVPDGTVTFQQDVTVDRWAGDLRTAAARRAPAELDSPGAYRPGAVAGDVPGWTSRHGLLVPPRFSPEDIGRATSVQEMATAMLAGASRRLREAGYPASHQVRAGLSPDVLLPNAAQLLSAGMLDLPGVPATDVMMRKLLPRVGLVPMAVRLAGLDSGVFREHLTQSTTSAGTAVNQQNVTSQTPRLLLGRGYMGDPYQALETSGTGPVSGDTAAVATGEDSGVSSYGNLKPENPSVLLEYVTRPVLSGTLTGHASGSNPVADGAGRQVSLFVRTGLEEARRVLGLGHGAPAAAVEAFDALVAAEKDLKTRADAFVDAADAEAAARYHAQGSDEPAVRQDWEAKAAEKDRCEDAFWAALREHYRHLDDYQATYVAIGDEVPV